MLLNLLCIFTFLIMLLSVVSCLPLSIINPFCISFPFVYSIDQFCMVIFMFYIVLVHVSRGKFGVFMMLLWLNKKHYRLVKLY